jgi:hypothetical protein
MTISTTIPTLIATTMTMIPDTGMGKTQGGTVMGGAPTIRTAWIW